MQRRTRRAEVVLGGERLRLVYDEAGEGARTALFLHGITSSRRIWEPTLDATPRGRRSIALDLPGFGDSTLPRAPQDLPRYLAALTLFLEQVAHPPVDVVGHSFGGMLAALLALAQPGWVACLVLVAPAGFVPPRASLTPLPHPLLNRLLLWSLARRRGGRDLLRGVGIPEEALTPVWRERLAHGLFRCREALRLKAFYETEPLGPRLFRAGRSSAYILGDADPLFPLARILPALGPGPVLLLREEGHVPMVGDSERFRLALEQALALERALACQGRGASSVKDERGGGASAS